MERKDRSTQSIEGHKIAEHTISDLDNFLKNPEAEVEIAGKTHQIMLDAHAISKLISRRSNLECSIDGPKNAIHAGDLYEFLSKPSVRFDSGITYPANLTTKNIHELITMGISKLR